MKKLGINPQISSAGFRRAQHICRLRFLASSAGSLGEPLVQPAEQGWIHVLLRLSGRFVTHSLLCCSLAGAGARLSREQAHTPPLTAFRGRSSLRAPSPARPGCWAAHELVTGVSTSSKTASDNPSETLGKLDLTG